MHMYCMIRGAKLVVDKYINDLMALWLPYEYKKGEPKGALQVAMRPIQLYEVVFPREQLEFICATMQPYSLNGKTAKEQKMANWLGKALGIVGLQKIPQDIKPNGKIFNQGVSVVGLGLKEDKWLNGIEQL